LRKLGLIGGMSWVSTALYYESINKGVAKRKGGLASAPLLIESLDFATVAKLQAAGEWDVLGEMMVASAKRLEKAGAEGLILCSNTAHRLHDWIDGEIKIPMLHIGDVTAAKLNADGVKRAGLIGTGITIREGFYRERLEAHGIQISVPEPGMA
jgi:aspartate racemase